MTSVGTPNSDTSLYLVANMLMSSIPFTFRTRLFNPTPWDDLIQCSSEGKPTTRADFQQLSHELYHPDRGDICAMSTVHYQFWISSTLVKTQRLICRCRWESIWRFCHPWNICRLHFVPYFLYFGEKYLATKLLLRLHFSSFENEILLWPQSVVKKFDLHSRIRLSRENCGWKACFSLTKKRQYPHPYYIDRYKLSRLSFGSTLYIRCRIWSRYINPTTKTPQ